MAASSVEDVVNLALRNIGYKKRVAWIYEGSPAARAALEIYGQTRDELLQAGDWPFALREVVLSVALAPPPSPWQNEYQAPADCLRLRYVRPGPLTGGTRSTDPQPALFRTWNDNRTVPAVRAILCDLNPAVAIYTARVTDPGTWTANFTDALAVRLGAKLAPILADQNMQKTALAVAEGERQQGMRVDDLAPPSFPNMTAQQRGQ